MVNGSNMGIMNKRENDNLEAGINPLLAGPGFAMPLQTVYCIVAGLGGSFGCMST